jgi:hypothetical protein
MKQYFHLTRRHLTYDQAPHSRCAGFTTDRALRGSRSKQAHRLMAAMVRSVWNSMVVPVTLAAIIWALLACDVERVARDEAIGEGHLRIERRKSRLQVYKRLMPNPKPARATVKVAGLIGDAKIEISAIAVKQ